MRTLTIILLALSLLQPWPVEPPRVEWALDNTRVIVSWSQGVSGQRCFLREEPPTDYGCVWAFQGAEQIVLPRAGATPGSLPQPGDIILMDSVRLIVPPRPVRHFIPAVR